MGEQMANRHALLAGPLKRGDVALDGRVEVDLPGVHQDHHRRGQSDHLRQRREVVDRCCGDGPPIVDAVVTDRRNNDVLVGAADHDHRAGECAVDLRTEIIQDRVETTEFILGLERGCGERREWRM